MILDLNNSASRKPVSVAANAHGGRLLQMDGLRGVAMLLVFLGHYGSVWQELVHPSGLAEFYLRVIDADSTLGSSFFMLLSAFFSYGSLVGRRRNFGEFLRGRLWRIYPLFLIMIAVYVVGSFVFPSMSRLPHGLLNIAVFLTQQALFLPGVFHLPLLMDVAWTLSFIFLFYFIEGALAQLFRVWRTSRVFRFGFYCSAMVAWALFCDLSGYWQPRTAMFWSGMAMWEVVDGLNQTEKRRAWAVRAVPLAGFVTVAGVLGRTVLMLAAPHTAFVTLAFYRVLITGLSLSTFVWVAYFGPEWFTRPLASVGLRKLGAASYSFYLTHGIAVKAFRFAIIPWLGQRAGALPIFWSSQLAGLVLAIVIARLTFVYVEDPLARLANHWKGGKASHRRPLLGV